MSATNETTNYKLPLFTDTDQPTWLGDFNGAMNKIDADMNTIGANASTALSAANNVVNRIGQAETTISGVQTAANNAVKRIGQVETTISGVQTTANNAYSLSTANEQGIGTLDGKVAQLESKFPITSGSLANGAVTAPKLDRTAIAAMWAGLTVKRFSATGSSADNAGMHAPSGAEFEGFYLAELGLLVVNKMSTKYNAQTDALFTLPNYIPNFAKTGIACEGAIVVWNNTNNFVTWTSVHTLQNTRNLRLSTYPAVGNSFSLLGSVVLYVGTNAGASLSMQDSYQSMNPTVG